MTAATKEMARMLGLLKRSSSHLPSLGKSNEKEQIFKYLVVLDFESTCWQSKGNAPQPEIIEFPAVLLNLTDGGIEDKFQYYVQPTENTKLSAFCTEFTGITQCTVDKSLPLFSCLKLFKDWIDNLTQTKLVSFKRMGECPDTHKHAIFATWSDWDLNYCLRFECMRKRIVYPAFLKSWVDLKSTYRSFYGRNPKGLVGALTDLGIPFVGRQHSGIDDACSTALLAWRLVNDGCILAATKSLLYPIEELNSNRLVQKDNLVGCKRQRGDQGDISTVMPLKAREPNLFPSNPLDVGTLTKLTPPLCKCGRRCKRKR